MSLAVNAARRFGVTQLLARTAACTQVRLLNLHEYQSKALMQQYNVRVQKFRVADRADQAQTFAKELSKYCIFSPSLTFFLIKFKEIYQYAFSTTPYEFNFIFCTPI